MRNTSRSIRKHFDDGGDVSGPIMGDTQGRDDTVSTEVPDGSHIIPADVVSAIGDGNTMAGMKKLSSAFPSPKGSSGISGGIGTPQGMMSHMKGMTGMSTSMRKPKISTHSISGMKLKQPKIPGLHKLGHLATGGLSNNPSGGDSDNNVPVKLSHGEFAIHPIHVKRVGDGDIEKGHNIFNHMIITVRAMDIARRKKLPHPA